MKKKLNLFCVLIFIVLVCDIASMSTEIATGFMSGYRHGVEGHDLTETGAYNVNFISVLPTDISDATAQTMVGGDTRAVQKVWPTRLIVPKGQRPGIFEAVFGLAVSLAVFVLQVAALVAFVCFVRNANRKRVFIRSNTTLLRLMGWCLVAAGVIMTAVSCYDTYLAQQSFSLSGYVVNYGDSFYWEAVIFGLFALVMAEAFALGLKMKEEQELTI